MATNNPLAAAANTKASGAQSGPLESEYQARGDLHTMTEAHRIRNDPGRHAAMKKYASSQMAVLKGIKASGVSAQPTGAAASIEQTTKLSAPASTQAKRTTDKDTTAGKSGIAVGTNSQRAHMK